MIHFQKPWYLYLLWETRGVVQYKISVRNVSSIQILRNLVLPITYCLVSQSFWNCAQNTAVSLPCSVQNFKMIRQLKQMLWANEISRDLSLRLISEGYPILHSTRDRVPLAYCRFVQNTHNRHLIIRLWGLDINIMYEIEVWSGVTKISFVNYPLGQISYHAKITSGFFYARSCFTGVTAAQMRRQLSNINVMFNS